MKRKLKFHLTSYQDMRELSVTMSCSIAIIMLCLSIVKGHSSFNYSEVEKFGNSCPRLDSCAYQRSTGRRHLASINERNCACDYLCSEYGDCCIDAPGNEMNATANYVKCFDLRQFGGVFMKDTCPTSYNGPDNVRVLCEETKLGEQTDPISSMPVTDSLTGLTYKNYYCSMCNDKTENIVMWTPRLECPFTLLNKSNNQEITKEYLYKNLVTDGRSWGLYLHDENGYKSFYDCEIDPVMPLELQSKIRLCKPDLVSTCPPNWKDKIVRIMCGSYMGAKYDPDHNGYKNVHCAICNNINVTRLSCQSAEQRMRGFDIFRMFGTHSFALLLDVNEKRGQEVGKIKLCEDGEVFDPFFKKCRSLVCLPGFIRQGGQCTLSNFEVVPNTSETPDGHTAFNGSKILESKSNATYENIELLTPIEGVTSNVGNLALGKPYNTSDIFADDVPKFGNCLLVSLTEEDYIMLPNQTIFVPKYDKLYKPSSYFVTQDSVLVCPPFTSSDHGTKFLPILGYTTIIGLGVSMLFLMLHFIAFCLVPDLQNLSGKNLVSLSLALFFAYFFFIFGQMQSLSVSLCTATAFLTFYFFQVSFFWMGIMAFDVWRTLRMATTELRVSSGKQMKRFFAYSLFAWVLPLLVLIILAFAEYTDLFPPLYRPGFSSSPCWFKQRRSLLVFFATPLFAVLLANIILFISSFRMIVETTQTSMKQQNKSQRRNFKLYLRLALLMGLTWVTGVIASCVDASLLWYLFVVLNTLQGLFIFIAFSCTTKVLCYLKNKFKITSRPKDFKSSSSNSGTSGTALTTKPPTLRTPN